MISCVNFVASRATSFGLDVNHIKKCISVLSTNENISEDNICHVVRNRIENIEEYCIQRAKIRGKSPKDYQVLAMRHMVKHRGLIAAFDVGTGKTLTAVMSIYCVDQLAQLFGLNINFIIVTPVTLIDNFKKEMIWYGLDINDSKYQFYGKEMFGIQFKKGTIDCSQSFLIIDEGHEFRTDYRGEFSNSSFEKKSKKLARDSGKIQRAEMAVNCAAKAFKVMILTGTAMYNREYDIVNLMAMVKGHQPIKKFQWEAVLKNEALFRQYFRCTILFQKAGTEHYPTRVDKFIEIPMSDEYYTLYHEAEDKEIEMQKNRLKKLKYIEKNNIENYDKKFGNSFMIIIRKAVNDIRVAEGSLCLKCPYVLNIIKEGKKTLVHSSFVTSGIKLVQEALDKEDPPIPYLEISGKIVDKLKRAEIVKQYIESDVINVLFITSAGEQGLDLKKVRNVILFEKGWNKQKEEQAIGRAVRYDSHEGLDEIDRNVTVYHLISVKPDWVKADVEKSYDHDNKSKNSNRYMLDMYSADEYLYIYNRKKQEKMDSISKNIEKVDVSHDPC